MAVLSSYPGVVGAIGKATMPRTLSQKSKPKKEDAAQSFWGYLLRIEKSRCEEEMEVDMSHGNQTAERRALRIK